MPAMPHVIEFSTSRREELVDITDRVRAIVAEHGRNSRLCSLFAQGATAALMIQENWDPSITKDVVNFLRSIIPQGVWLHDEEDGNGDAHIKAGIVGPSEVIPIENGRLLLGTWQNIFFCEFDGPRDVRRVIVTLI